MGDSGHKIQREQRVTVQLQSRSQTTFFAPARRMGLVTTYSIFIQVRLNVGMMFFSNLMLESLKIAFHIVCQRSTTEMDIDRATLVAACV